MSMVGQVNWKQIWSVVAPADSMWLRGDMQTDTQADGADYDNTLSSDWAEGREHCRRIAYTGENLCKINQIPPFNIAVIGII